ncbi:retrotransposon protein, putative, ty1-copia subclass [Tanacetum coccineum]
MMKAGFLDFGGGAKKKKINDSNLSEKVNSATDMLTPAVMDLSKQAIEFPSLETLNGKPTDSRFALTRKSVNFRTFFTLGGNGVDVVVLVESIRAINEWFANTAYGFFLRKRVAYSVVANFVRNTWGKYGLVKSMLNSSTGLFSFQFSSMDSLNATLENEDVGNVPVLVKLHVVPITTYSEDVLSAIATKLGTPLMLDSYTSDMCLQSWGKLGYARAIIELQANVELNYTIVVAMPKLVGEVFYTCTIHVEYEWKPPRCACCKVFGHIQDECPMNKNSDVVKNMKKPCQTHRGVSVGYKVGCQLAKQVYRQVSKKNNVSTNGNKKKDMEPTIEVSKSNPFDVLNSVNNDVDLGTNGGTSNLAIRLILDGTATLVDDEGKSLTRVDSLGDHDSEDEVASVDNDMAKFLASKDVGYGTNSLLQQWKESYGNGEYDYDLYDDDMYEGQDRPDKIQDICDNLDIKVCGRKKK